MITERYEEWDHEESDENWRGVDVGEKRDVEQPLLECDDVEPGKKWHVQQPLLERDDLEPGEKWDDEQPLLECDDVERREDWGVCRGRNTGIRTLTTSTLASSSRADDSAQSRTEEVLEMEVEESGAEDPHLEAYCQQPRARACDACHDCDARGGHGRKGSARALRHSSPRRHYRSWGQLFVLTDGRWKKPCHSTAERYRKRFRIQR